MWGLALVRWKGSSTVRREGNNMWSQTPVGRQVRLPTSVGKFLRNAFFKIEV